MTDIFKRFGATRALRGVSLELRAGQALALIGENGAGKSTLMKVLSGAHTPDGGSMELAGRTYAPRGPHAARLAGVAMIYQELNLAQDLSVEENVMLGQEHTQWGVVDRVAQRRQVRAALERLGHAGLPLDTPVWRLSVGMQQLVEIARALASHAKVIVFDEPTSSLAQADVERLFQTIARLRQEGLGVIYISHFLEEIRRACDSYTVLRDGETVDSGMLAGTSEARLVSLMVGRGIEELYPSVPHTPGEIMLSLSGLSGVQKPQNVSFDLRRGEILGLAGLVGAGRTELVRSIFAPDPAWLLVVPGVWIMLAMAAILSLVLRYTVFGRYVFALGSNEQTARLCGLNVPALKVAVYTLGGLFIGLAGVYQFAKLKVGNPTSGVGLELKVIAAVVIGGASLSGGRGTVLGTLTGALLMQTIASGCTQFGLSNPVQDIILGVIIVAAVTVDQIRQRRAAQSSYSA